MDKERILLVDDEEHIVELCQRTLSASGYQVAAADSFTGALTAAGNEECDLLVTDMKMPDGTGLDLLKKLRAKHPDLPAIIITGYGTIDMVIDCLKQGTQGFLLKPFTADELVETVENSLQNSRALKENIRLKALLPLAEMRRTLLIDLTLDELIQNIVSVLKRSAGAVSACLALIESGDNLVLKASKGGRRTAEGAKTFTKIGRETLKRRMPILIPGHGGDEHLPVLESLGIGSVASLPLLVGGNPIGALSVSRAVSERNFEVGDIEVLSILAGEVAVAIENAGLYESLHDFYLSTVRALILAIEAKDFYTRGHSEKVAKLAVAIAKRLGLRGTFVNIVQQAGLLHDIGKIGLPESILLKPGPLSDSEFAEVYKHPLQGAEILSPIRPLNVLVPLVKHHHERWDGGGYPNGLARESIPHGARILAVADAFDAMTSDRPYRSALSFDAARSEIERGKGEKFDPEVARVLLLIADEEGEAVLGRSWGEKYLVDASSRAVTISLIRQDYSDQDSLCIGDLR